MAELPTPPEVEVQAETKAVQKPVYKPVPTAPSKEEIRAKTNEINAKQIGATLRSTYVNPDDVAYKPAMGK